MYHVHPQHHGLCSTCFSTLTNLSRQPLTLFPQLIEAFTDSTHLFMALDGSTFGLNLLFPIGNLVRATLVGLNVYIVDCRDGNFVHSPSSIYAYGGPILLLCLQICFLFWLLNWLEERHNRKYIFPFHIRHKSIVGSDEEGKGDKVAEKEVLEEEKRVKDSEDDLLRVLGVSKTFGTTKAVDNVSLGISSGEILALLGPNGAGKSTIINMIRGDLSPDHGEILLQGIDMQKQRRMGQRYIGCKFSSLGSPLHDLQLDAQVDWQVLTLYRLSPI